MPPQRSAPAISLAALLAILACEPARAAADAAAIPPSEEYADCMALTKEAPVEAFERARIWEAGGGGLAARHCGAVALIQLEEYGEAATRLEALAKDVPAGRPRLTAEILGQAGQAWLLAGEVNRAYSAQTAALELIPDGAELLIDRSITLATAGKYWEAIDDLNRADELAPNRPDLLLLRATAYRHVGGLELAIDDVQRSLRLQPRNPDALLERGIIRSLMGNPDGARQDWIAVVTLAPDKPSAEAARSNLAKLDLKTD